MDDDAGTWVLQAEAAARTGFSVSAVRKWRRLGLVAERKITSSTGMERVEVRLEDVLARAALQPDRHRAESRTEVDSPERRVVLEFDDLEELFDRLFIAEQRAERAETEVASLRAQLTATRRETPGPGRDPEELAGQPFDQARQRPPEVSPPRPMDAPHEPIPPAPAITSNVGSRVAAGQNPTVAARPEASVAGRTRTALDEGRGAPSVAPVAKTSRPDSHAGQRTKQEVEALTGRLRGSYARLDEYRRAEVFTSATEREWQRELAEYDRLLLAVCAALEIPTGLPAGQPVSAEARATLTRGLARAGFDVRAGLSASRDSPRQRVPWKRRS